MLLGAMPTINAAAKDWWVRYQNLTQGPDGLKTQLHFGEVPLTPAKRVSGTANLSQGIILSGSWLVSNSRVQGRPSNREHPS
jgi:hypothetical protein